MPFLTNDMMRSIIMDHYSNPMHKHQPKGEGYTKIHMHSDNCIDDMDIFVLVENNTIKDACFDGVGCTIATSSSDIMCELLIGKTIEEANYIIEQYNNMIYEREFDEDVLVVLELVLVELLFTPQPTVINKTIKVVNILFFFISFISLNYAWIN